MENFNNLIFVLNGPSAGGKTLALEELIKRSEVNVEKLVTVTTRRPRSTPKQEVNGYDYYFLTPEKFHAKVAEAKRAEELGIEAEDAIVEQTEYPKDSGVFYGIFDSEIKRIARLGRDALAVLDIHGVKEMKRFYGAENVVSIFVYRNPETILEALKERNLPEAEIKKRMDYAQKEFLNVAFADHVVYNLSDKETLFRNVIKVINEERAKREKKVS